jgi:hypothetical protein
VRYGWEARTIACEGIPERSAGCVKQGSEK